MFFAAFNDKFEKRQEQSSQPASESQSPSMTAAVAHRPEPLRSSSQDPWSLSFSAPLPSPGFINTSFGAPARTFQEATPITTPQSAPIATSSSWYQFGNSTVLDQSSNFGFSYSSPIPSSAPPTSDYLPEPPRVTSHLTPYNVFGYDDDAASMKGDDTRQHSAPCLSPGGSPDFVRAPSFGASDYSALESRRAHSMQPTPTPTTASTQTSFNTNGLSRVGHNRASSLNATSPDSLQPEDKLLLRLKVEEALSWKEIAARFQSELGQTYQIPALQMRYKRLKERIKVWESTDIEALKKARDYWETKKYEIIASKMAEFGAQEKHSAEACKRKLGELSSDVETPPRKVLVQYTNEHTSSRRSRSPASTTSSVRAFNMRPPPLPSNSQPPSAIPAEAFGAHAQWQPWSH